SGPPARISVVGLMQIVFALGLDVLFEGPNIRPVTMVGILMVLAPTAWMMSDPSRRGSKGTGTTESRFEQIVVSAASQRRLGAATLLRCKRTDKQATGRLPEKRIVDARSRGLSPYYLVLCHSLIIG